MKYADYIGAEPEHVVRPESVEEAVEVVRWASEGGRAVIPWGGGTGQTYGYLPARADILLDLSGLNAVLSHEPGDLTVTVQGGATLATVQDTLALHNQYLPLDPPHETVATVGGILATNAYGASRTGHGTARDWLIGIQVIDGQGRTVRGGGKVVKNVTGYDIPKLHTGALGTLGVIVEATFKVAPRPEATRGLLFGGGNAEFVTRLHGGIAPAMSLLRETDAGKVLAVIYTGFTEVVEQAIEQARTLADQLGAAPTSLPVGIPAPFTGEPPESPLIVRVTGKINETVARHTALIDMGIWSQADTYPGAGVTDLYLVADEDPESAWISLTEWALRNAVSVAALHAPTSLRRDPARVNLWAPMPASLPIQRRLKSTLDPTRTLNPGRFLGGI